MVADSHPLPSESGRFMGRARQLAADNGFTFVAGVYFAAICASLAAAGIITMGLAVGCLIVALFCCVALPFLTGPSWLNSRTHKTILAIILAASLPFIFFYERAHFQPNASAKDIADAVVAKLVPEGHGKQRTPTVQHSQNEYSDSNQRSRVGNDSVVMGRVPPNQVVGDRSVVVGATDDQGNTILTTPMAVGHGATAGHGSIAIGAGAHAGATIQQPTIVSGDCNQVANGDSNTQNLDCRRYYAGPPRNGVGLYQGDVLVGNVTNPVIDDGSQTVRFFAAHFSAFPDPSKPIEFQNLLLQCADIPHQPPNTFVGQLSAVVAGEQCKIVGRR
jgi:hypothetical protein